MNEFILQLRKVILGRDGANLSDGQLLERFIDAHDEAAFEALVRRHGPMVLRVCRHVIGDEHDAEDAFQATFLVLARKAEMIEPRDQVSNWLCGVAFRTGQAARASRLRRLARERQLAELQHPAARPASDPDMLPLLDRELNRLPEKFRLPIILCGVEGRGRKEVAAQLSLPEGTLASRLDTARRLLAKRLARYGVAISAPAAVLGLPKTGLAHPPAALVTATVHASLTDAPAAVLALANGVGSAATWLRFKMVAALLFTLVGVGGGLAAWQVKRPDPVPPPALAQTVLPPRPLPEKQPVTLAVAPHQATDEERLQGVWNAVQLERDGEAMPLTEKVGLHLVFVQDDKVMTHFLRAPAGDGYVTATVRLDPTTNPKTLEILHGSGRLWEGIYLLEDDTMTVCVVPVGHQRPTSFTTTANTPPMLVIFKRDASVVWDMAKWQKAVAKQS